MRLREYIYLTRATLSSQFSSCCCSWLSNYTEGNFWSLVDLSDADTVIANMKTLDRLRWRNTAEEERAGAYYNLWGWFEKRNNRGI